MRQFLLFVCLFGAVQALAQSNWSPQTTGFPNPNTGVKYLHVVDEHNLWITGYNGSDPSDRSATFAVSNNGGISFSNDTAHGYTGYGTSMIFGLDSMTAYMPIYGPAGGGAILKTTDRGQSWTEQNTATFSAPEGFPNLVHFWDSLTGFCAGDPNQGYFEIYTTTDGGDNWIRVPQQNIPDPQSATEYGITGYYSVAGDTVWFTTNEGRLFRSLNRGIDWTVSTPPIGGATAKVFFRNAQHGIIFDNTSTPIRLWESFDGGDTWGEVYYTGTVFGIDICYVPGISNTWVSSGNNEGISYSYDGGHSWSPFQGIDGMSFLSTRFYNQHIGWAGSFTTTPFNHGINRFDGNMQPWPNDVGVVSIDVPEVAEPGDMVPRVTFKNFGTITQSFDVSFSITGIYTSIKNISDLQPFQTKTVYFDTWIATEGTYTLSASVWMGTDQDSLNDNKQKTVEIMDLTEAYAYVATDQSGSLPQGPIKMFLEAPSIAISLDNQANQNFVASGTWGPNEQWYGGVYFNIEDTSGGEFITLDPITGARTTIGFMGYSPVHGMSYDFTTNTMYAVTYNNTTSILHTINLQSGALTKVGNTDSDILINLACSPQGQLFAVDAKNDMFGSVDKVSGKFTSLFSIGFDAQFAQDMEFDQNTGTCYMAAFNLNSGKGELYAVDPNLLQMTMIGNLAYGAEITGFAIPDGPISIDEHDAQILLQMYPNPSGDFLFLTSDEKLFGCRIYNMNGGVVLESSNRDFFYQIDIGHLPSGMYMVEVHTAVGLIMRKVSKI